SYLGSAHYAAGNHEFAEQHHLHAYSINLEIGSKVGFAFYYFGMAKVKLALCQDEAGKSFLKKAREQSEQLELKGLLIEIQELESSL
ncbi:MAG: hypothetical protein M3P33_03190, partial [bacterium]|nr:hypothetical protein [bacterium]